MDSSRDLYARGTNGFSHPTTNTTQRDATEAPQGQYQVVASQNTTLHQRFSQMQQQPTPDGRAYHAQRYRQPSTNQGTPSNAYAPSSTHLAHQGSRDPYGYDDAPGAQYRVNFPGVQHSPVDPQQMTARFAYDQQRGGHRSSSDEAEQNGIRRGINTISRFNSQFSGAANTDAPTQNAHRGAISSNGTQNSIGNHYGYPSTVDYKSQSGSSSRTQI
ncbi:hypothetical protein F53441_6212 [Fusarium austroafricanum]|uniref:Uncharacterized protein n=1 Tax=Fusarium austroafricanum TaxID=2364996 RepID=A0A8H4KJ22_9HYPO|nr:hypothetical protein F53441_6212 [Fusarium austroafricanum]